MNDRDIAGGRGADSEPDSEELDRLAAGPLDEIDLAILDQVADLYEALDPAPEMLPELVLFGLRAVDLDAELARLVESELTPAGAGARAVEQARRVTFSSPHLTVMIAVSEHGRDTVRLDGWSTPGAGLLIEVRAGDAVLSGRCDEDGRFSFDAVPHGMVQLTLTPTPDSDPAVAVPVVTPAVRL